MEEKLRKTGIDLIGDVIWGIHFCQFFQTKEDLIDILVPYFKTGLENNEFCMWITSKPLKVEEAKAQLKKEVTDLDKYIKKGQIEILDYSQWYTKSGKFESANVLQGWVEKEQLALKKGFDGLRLTENTFWLEKKDWKDFTEYEEEVNKVIGKYKMLAICSYSLERCGASEVIDVVSNHQFALIKREGKWELIESSERKKAEEELHRNQEEFQIILDSVPAMVFYKDKKDKFLTINTPMARAFKMSKEEIVGKTAAELSPTKDYWEDDKKVMQTGNPLRNIIEPVETSEGTRWVQTDKIPYRDANGNILGIIGFAVDITEQKQAKEKINASLREKEVLLQEVHHRVKNNLQVISSLLSLQSQHSRSKKLAELLKASENRIKSMSLVHEKLYASEDLTKINFMEYITALTSRLVSSYESISGKIALKIDVADISLEIGPAIHCGLLINELVSNSIRHAFPGEKKGEIQLAFRPIDGKGMELVVSDDGIGMPEDMDFRNTKTLGMHLVTILAEKQLQGKITLDRAKGTKFLIRFKMK